MDVTKFKKSLKDLSSKDLKTLIFLLYLHILQASYVGIMMTLSPKLLGSSNVRYAGHASLTLIYYPFITKIIWGPFIDTYYVKAIGRRKCWLLLSSFLLGVWLVYHSSEIDNYMETRNIPILIKIFMIASIILTIQDIALEGWWITCIDRKKNGLVSIVLETGNIIGHFTGYTLVIVVSSKSYSNYIRSFLSLSFQNYPIFTIGQSVKLMGALFIISCTIITVFMTENSDNIPSDDMFNKVEGKIKLMSILKILWRLIKSKLFKKYAKFLILILICPGITEPVIRLKLIEAGVTEETSAIITSLTAPLQIIGVVYISRYCVMDRPLDLYKMIYIPLIVMNLVLTMVYYKTCMIKNDWINIHGYIFLKEKNSQRQGQGAVFPLYWYFVIACLYCIFIILKQSLLTSIIAYNIKIADVTISSTMLALLAAVGNIVKTFSATFGLYFADKLLGNKFDCISKNGIRLKEVSNNSTNLLIPWTPTLCDKVEGFTVQTLDNSYIQVILVSFFGLFVYTFIDKTADTLSNANYKDWEVDFRGIFDDEIFDHIEQENKIQLAVYDRIELDRVDEMITSPPPYAPDYNQNVSNADLKILRNGIIPNK